MNNPFFTDYNLPYDAVPFSKFKTEDFIPAVEKSIKLTMDRINQIINNNIPIMKGNGMIPVDIDIKINNE